MSEFNFDKECEYRIIVEIDKRIYERCSHPIFPKCYEMVEGILVTKNTCDKKSCPRLNEEYM